MFWERLQVCINNFWKNWLSRIWKNLHWNYEQAYIYEKEYGKGKSGSLYEETFKLSNYEKTGIETKCFKLKTNNTLKSYKKLKNYWRKKERKNFFETFNLSFVVDNKKFWKVVKPLLNEKKVGLVMKLFC